MSPTPYLCEPVVGWGAPEDEEVHSYINQLASAVGTYLYARRMYATMVYLGDRAHGSQPAAVRARLGATMAGGREDPDAVRRLKAKVRHEITVDGPELAA